MDGLGTRTSNTSLVALLKRVFSSALREETVKVRIENGDSLKGQLSKISGQLQSVENLLQRMCDNMGSSDTTFDVDTGTSEQLQKVVEALDKISGKLDKDSGSH